MRRLLLFTFIILMTSTAYAGVKIRMDTRQEGADSIQSGWIYAEGPNWLRIDVDIDESTGEPTNSMIFRADQNVLFMVDHIEQQYSRLDEHTMEDFTSNLKAAMEQMQAELEKMPENERKIMEDMMKKNTPQSGAFKVEVKDIGMDGELHKYETWIAGEKRSEVWVKSVEKIGIEPDILTSFKKLSAFYEKMLSSLSNVPFAGEGGIGANPFPGFLEMNGLPVRIVHLEEEIETLLTDVQSAELPEAFFQPPSEYEENSPHVH
jgi:hypothetical protein